MKYKIYIYINHYISHYKRGNFTHDKIIQYWNAPARCSTLSTAELSKIPVIPAGNALTKLSSDLPTALKCQIHI
ncbi:mersacidin/lichenicidin family type 2 lantibiotic [Bacillus pseudomycoides]|uniref:mersacidin/lichenicidin family type 2 lantibiotic n=1 Tax=Bacillus TaxID=1386 RepID=UPI00099216E7|nr:mersacidin/lichenicidin family type 2 lantibiotic [Bacillus pseudomycoides]PEU33432.1 mersacidin/lichenicidin family type 2 lantibiotic [Bacillus pseudomycoides]PFY17242.1 mersacidin/lichenicidin family type 2 lantibiotic [Bacillus pseudomycoides]PGA69186.1 mersacidin/lichenicidin family type 2 lantibiotic [Bacillus pseudomycoides]